MPLELFTCVELGTPPGNCGGCEFLSPSRLPRTNKRCVFDIAKSILARYVFRVIGFGADQVNDPVFNPSPRLFPLGTGYLLNCARLFGSTPGPQGQVVGKQPGSMAASCVGVNVTMLPLTSTYFINPCRKEAVGTSQVS